MNWLAMAAMLLVANFLGDTLVERLGFGATYALGVTPHLALVVLLSRLQLRAGPADAAAGGRSLLANLQDEIAYLRVDPAVRWTVLLMWIAVFGGANVLWSLGAAWMRDVMELGPRWLEPGRFLWSLGMIGASLTLLAGGSYRGKGRVFVGAGALSGVAVIVYALSRSIPLTGTAMFFAGLAFQLQQTVGTTILQTVVPRPLLGRVPALVFLAHGRRLRGWPLGARGELLTLQVVFPIVGAVSWARAFTIAALHVENAALTPAPDSRLPVAFARHLGTAPNCLKLI